MVNGQLAIISNNFQSCTLSDRSGQHGIWSLPNFSWRGGKACMAGMRKIQWGKSSPYTCIMATFYKRKLPEPSYIRYHQWAPLTYNRVRQGLLCGVHRFDGKNRTAYSSHTCWTLHCKYKVILLITGRGRNIPWNIQTHLLQIAPTYSTGKF